MKRIWQTSIVGTISLSLLITAQPAFAKNESERSAKKAQIEADQEISLRANPLHSRGSSFDFSEDLVLIQFTGPIQEKWKEELADAGIELGDYIPDFSFIAKVTEKEQQKLLKKLSYIKRVTAFEPEYKLAPELREAVEDGNQVDVAVIGFDKKSDLHEVLERLDEDEYSKLETKTAGRAITDVRVKGNKLDELLDSDDVIAVLPKGKIKLHNDQAAKIIQSDELADTGYEGNGQVIGVADTGLDTGNVRNMHPDLADQVKKLYALGRRGDASDPVGHGTHVAGSLVGNGSASNGKITGMAPEAKLVFQSIMDEEGAIVFDSFYDLLDEAYDDGARIHSDSWGLDPVADPEIAGVYDETAYEADRFLWEHKDMLLVVAAGNEGDEYGLGSVSSPATAKNAIAVGATENLRPSKGSLSDDEDEIAYFSSKGPTADGRFKPDLVAPGTFILSTRSRLAPDDQFWDTYNSDYAYMGGTSMATPILAGGAAQVREYLQEEGIKKPSAALIKSMLITGADILDDAYFEEQGYGRVNLEKAIGADFADETSGLKTGQKQTYSIEVTDTKHPFLATLVWTDYPASPAARRALVNDLNLKITAPSGQVYNGNDFFDDDTDDDVDNKNNVEEVWIDNPEKGTYQVTVEAYNIPMGPQPFALSTNGKLKEQKTKKLTKKGTLSSKSKKYVDYNISVKTPGTISLVADWDDEDADVDLYLYNSSGKKLVSSTSSKNYPETLDYAVTKAGTYKVRIRLDSSGSTDYVLEIHYPASS
ncbi:S8 family serine peptidase [Brevibacillus fulvus]|uniref:Subtilisin family serine protease/uncharacterized protein YfaP (DUF2135 family) n=1 Tax=Brevibacillus fulvus TaxID=1125967 RepID=A0A938Y2J1_9BACL|nr:S8 family serine peptidase [Brevibacillus fulvus]MBM7590457.1 subtilisin family serine protease/uncharacterized protein YfaP (DUF2135 family) [Brevibacillus fulvus]